MVTLADKPTANADEFSLYSLDIMEQFNVFVSTDNAGYIMQEFVDIYADLGPDAINELHQCLNYFNPEHKIILGTDFAPYSFGFYNEQTGIRGGIIYQNGEYSIHT